MNAINKNEVSMFKVGDVVVNTNGAYEHIEHVAFVDSDGYFKTKSGLLCNPKVHRLATSQEIALGHRIDLEELRDCDTSPNGKKYER